MKDVIAEFYTAISAKATAGEALEDASDRVYLNTDDQDFDHDLTLPAIFLDPHHEMPLDACQGSEHVINRGVIEVVCVVDLDRMATGGHDTAQDAAGDLRGNLERVLVGLRTKTSAGHPTGVWHHMDWMAGSAGVSAGFTDGPQALRGRRCYIDSVLCHFTFRRTRQAA